MYVKITPKNEQDPIQNKKIGRSVWALYSNVSCVSCNLSVSQSDQIATQIRLLFVVVCFPLGFQWFFVYPGGWALPTRFSPFIQIVGLGEIFIAYR